MHRDWRRLLPVAIWAVSAIGLVALAFSVNNLLRPRGPEACHPFFPLPPAWRPPSGCPRSDCSRSQIDAIVGDCYVKPDKEKCQDDRFAYPACAACMITDENSPVPGPLIERGHRVSVNEGGCLALMLGETTAAGCGRAWGTYEDCEWTACLDRCWGADARGVDGGNLALSAACNAEANAEGGVCNRYRQSAFAACPLHGKEYETCRTGRSTEEQTRNVAAIFCAARIDSGI